MIVRVAAWRWRERVLVRMWPCCFLPGNPSARAGIYALTLQPARGAELSMVVCRPEANGERGERKIRQNERDHDTMGCIARGVARSTNSQSETRAHLTR